MLTREKYNQQLKEQKHKRHYQKYRQIKQDEINKVHDKVPKHSWTFWSNVWKWIRRIYYFDKFCFIFGLIIGSIIMAVLLLNDLNLASGITIILVLALIVYLWKNV